MIKKQIKTTKKVDKKVKKAILKQIDEQIHNADYWINRPIDDPHKDWDYPGNWIEGYGQSHDHLHRRLILNNLKKLEPFDSLLELGCNCGPNLNLIQKKYPGINLAGIDVDERVIDKGKDELRNIDFVVGNFVKLPWNTKQFDVVLADAVLMYLNKEEILQCLDEIDRVTKKGVIIVDRFDKSLDGVRNGNVWARDYETLLKVRGWNVEKFKIKAIDWPNSIGWKKFGYVFIATK